MQLLLAARIARIYRPHRRHHMIMTIDLVDKNDARLGVFVSGGNDAVPDIGCENHPRHWRFFDNTIGQIGGLKRQFIGKRRAFAVRSAIDDVVGSGNGIKNTLHPRLAFELGLKPHAAVHRVHKKIADGHRNIEIREARLIVFSVDEPQNIGVRDRQNAHICTATDTALLDDLSRLIDDIHKRDGARSHAACRIDHRACGTQKFISHSRTAACLVNDRDVLGVFHNALDRIGDV